MLFKLCFFHTAASTHTLIQHTVYVYLHALILLLLLDAVVAVFISHMKLEYIVST